MYKFKSIALLGAAALSVVTAGRPALAQSHTATEAATGSVTIIRPITITKTTDLAFGRVVSPRTGSGTVSIANNSASVVAGSGAVALGGLATSHAEFAVNGEGAQVVNVTAPSTFDLSNGGSTITVNLDPDWNTTTNQVTLSGTAGSAGSSTLNLGGHFSLPSSQASGAYSGTFNVSVAYN